MNKKQTHSIIKSLLISELPDVVIEIRNLKENLLEIDVASNEWTQETTPERVIFILTKLLSESVLKAHEKACVICPVTLDEYFSMKKKEMKII